MTVRTCLLAGWLSCLGANIAAPMVTAQETVPSEPRKIKLEDAASAPNANQQLADAVAGALNRNVQLKNYRIDVVVVGDMAELQGQVADAAQRDLAHRTARSIPGIGRIHDRLTVGNIEVAAATQDLVPNAPMRDAGPLLAPGGAAPFPPAPNQVNPQFAPIMPIPNNSFTPEPTPVFHGQPGMMPNPQYQPPPMPPYAWPTYAPYNNYSRVAQPKTYSHDQWPFIGPMYPYPKVPLGWRKVTLEWQDGSWYYGREATSHDWWRVRYW